jgi:hypothetical protein
MTNWTALRNPACIGDELLTAFKTAHLSAFQQPGQRLSDGEIIVNDTNWVSRIFRHVICAV